RRFHGERRGCSGPGQYRQIQRQPEAADCETEGRRELGHWGQYYGHGKLMSDRRPQVSSISTGSDGHSLLTDGATDAGSGGKTARFEDLAIPHLDAVYTLARYLLRNTSDADDAAQECYLRAFRHFDTFRGGPIKPWLFAILRNVCHTTR